MTRRALLLIFLGCLALSLLVLIGPLDDGGGLPGMLVGLIWGFGFGLVAARLLPTDFPR